MKLGPIQLAHSEPLPEGDVAPVAGGLAVMAVAAVSELGDLMTPGQLHGFFVAVGRRLAASRPLARVSDASTLCARVNDFWQKLGWGEVEVVVAPDAIFVHHRDAPEVIPGVDRATWRAVALALFEGAYDAWFRDLGSGQTLLTAASWEDGMVKVRHGR